MTPDLRAHRATDSRMHTPRSVGHHKPNAIMLAIHNADATAKLTPFFVNNSAINFRINLSSNAHTSPLFTETELMFVNESTICLSR